MQYYNNKTVWITGASSGIGKSFALQLAAMSGIKLIISDRNEEELVKVEEECKSIGAQCKALAFDLEHADELPQKAEEALSFFNGVDMLFNCGGISQRSQVIETPIEIDRKIMEIDFFSNVILTKAVLPHMVKQNFGHIVAISSISGIFGFPERSAYCSAKHALYGFYEALDIEMRGSDVNVTIIAPGRIQTNISLSAITKDGTAHGKMDKGQLEGMPVDVCTRKCLKAIAKKRHEYLVGRKELILAQIYRKCPWLFHKIVNNIGTR